MQRLLTLITILVLLSTLSGCLYVQTRAPYDRDLDRTELGTKVGRANNYSVLWLVAWGITVLRHADVEVFSVLFGLYVRRTVIVYGD